MDGVSPIGDLLSPSYGVMPGCVALCFCAKAETYAGVLIG
jgi:hypothetical protein